MIKSIYKKIFPEKFRNELLVKLRKVNAYFLKGNDFYCPCCEKSSSKFLKKGNGLVTRENAVCPNCGSLERSRLLKLFLEKETEIFKNNPYILHFAPEDSLKNMLKSNPNYRDVDLNPNLATLQMDITDLKFPDKTFDFIICSHVLGHIPDEKKALSEMYRVLKSEGKLLLLSLMDLSAKVTLENINNDTPEKKLQAYGEFDLQRLYGLDFEERIQSDEVSVEKIDYRNNFDKEERQKMSLGNGEREIIFQVTKR